MKRKNVETDDEIPSKILIQTTGIHHHVPKEIIFEKLISFDANYAADDDLSNEKTTINHLPNEMLLNIFSKLDDADIILTICNVCKRWYDLYGQSKFFKEEFYIDTTTTDLEKCYDMYTDVHHFSVNYRKDLKSILNRVPVFCHHLRFSSFKHCWGWRCKPPLPKHCLIVRIIKHERVGISPWKCKRRKPYKPRVVGLFQTPVSYIYKQNYCS